MKCSLTDDTRVIQYDAIQDGDIKLKHAVRRLVHGLRPKGRKNPIHLQDILAWFRGVQNKDMIHAAIHQLEEEHEIIGVMGTGGYRIKTFGDMVKERAHAQSK